MLTRVDVQSENPFYMEIRDSKPTDSIIVEKIEGLDPPDITLFMGDYARDGGTYNGRRVPPRSPIFTLKINPNYQVNESVDGLRALLYKAFLDPFVDADGLNIILKFDNKPDQYIQGVVSKFETEIFSEDTFAVISMSCPNPFLQDVNETVIEPDPGPTIPFDYAGTAETGLLTTLVMTDAASLLTLDLNGSKMSFTYDFLEGDLVTVDTRVGSRRILVTRTVGEETTVKSILYSKNQGSVWLKLHSPEYVLSVYGTDDDDVVANITNITFRAQHWGI